MRRRDFLSTAGLTLGGMALAPAMPSAAIIPTHSSSLRKDAMIGVQMGPHSILEEGMESVLDFLKEEAKMNTIVMYSHTYYDAGKKPLRVMAKDHFKAPIDLSDHNLRRSWVTHDPSFFKDTKLRHRKVDSSFQYHDREVFHDIRKPATDRDMKVYFRILETKATNGIKYIDHFDQVVVKDVNGKAGNWPCWNNPDYRHWVYATIEDIFTNYEVDGLQYGAERIGPLSEVWYKGEAPTCFCAHCRRRNEDQGIDADRAAEGYKLMHEYMKKVELGTDDSPDTVTVKLWSYMQRYPEILAWNYEYYRADEEIQQEIYNRSKKIRSDAIVGRHVDHQRSSWDLFYRSAVNYREMADSADFIKPIVYHDVYGPRLRWWVIEEWKKRGYRDFEREQILEMFYNMMGYSSEAQIALNRLEPEGMGPAYVYDEVKRCVNSVGGKAEVVAGLGIDVLWHGGGQQPYPSDPTELQKAVFKAVEAGATGILASREYDEMRFSSLRAFGEAIHQLQ